MVIESVELVNIIICCLGEDQVQVGTKVGPHAENYQRE